MFADLDDDDDDGVADAKDDASPRAAVDAVRIDLGGKPARIVGVEGDAARLFIDGRVTSTAGAKGRRARKRLELQGTKAGVVLVDLGRTKVRASVVELRAVDSDSRRVDLARSHASLSRVTPEPLRPEPTGAKDPDSLRWMAVGPAGSVPSRIDLGTTRADGSKLDVVAALPLAATTCPRDVPRGLECWQSPPVRLTVDDIDRQHPALFMRSLRAEVGGRVTVRVDDRKAGSIRVGGPRTSKLGAIGRYRGRLRVRIVRLTRGGSVPVGGNAQGALALAREQVRTASSLWGQCGAHFGEDAELDIRIVDPPPPHLLAIGCDLGQPTSGGTIAFEAGGREIRVALRPGLTPAAAAQRVAAALERRGFVAVLSGNAKAPLGALRTFDVLVRRRSGVPVPLAALPSAPLSSDATLGVCIGEVDLTNGLSHFTDHNAVAGTLEERALIKAFDDGDPGTIEVLIVPSFARTGRIGESFIHAAGSGVQNVVVIDRAGIRAGARSYALAHELGHILLEMPGHPDDYGVDTPSLLMDADAADPTIFGPRRISVAECERMLLQSGPTAPVPLLKPWPLFGDRGK